MLFLLGGFRICRVSSMMGFTISDLMNDRITISIESESTATRPMMLYLNYVTERRTHLEVPSMNTFSVKSTS